MGHCAVLRFLNVVSVHLLLFLRVENEDGGYRQIFWRSNADRMYYTGH